MEKETATVNTFLGEHHAGVRATLVGEEYVMKLKKWANIQSYN